ncbi:MAG: hypothetical protein LQ340_002174 [Diploschistes diacapsis]|nr:MAG: hypothetical protein LQ340_002174 [Diploschistes diacapsis]
MRIIIVGAGLGGLAAAYCFAHKGHEVKLLERRHELSKKGGSISIRPGATRVLISWGLKEQFEAISDNFATTLFRDLYTGEIINSSIAVEVSDYPDWGTERGVTQEVLYNNVVKAGAEIRINCQVDDVCENASGAVVVLGDGSTIMGDIVLVADGIRSHLRGKILEDASASVDPLASNVTLYGMKLGLEEARSDPDLAKVCEDTSLNVSFGNGTFVVFRVNEKLQQFGVLFGVKGLTDQKGLWDEVSSDGNSLKALAQMPSQDGNVDHVRKVFSNANPALVAALKLATSCDRWRLAELPDLPRWCSKGGRILLLGDSAHAMYPSAAQGFSQIIEDIGALEYLLSLPKPIRSLSALWESVRKPRVERIKEYSNANTQMFLGNTPRAGPFERRDIAKTMNYTFDAEVVLMKTVPKPKYIQI